ncbi:MAG: vWA domain-containing protein, partial [Steroidobacteraceae bacterium]
GTALAIDQIRQPGTTTLPSGPKAVVLISDGRDNASTRTKADVIAAANAAGVSIFTIGVGSVSGSLLQDLAAGTGGAYLAAPTANQIADAYQSIANTLGNDYLLSFSSSITDCSSHTLEVRVTNQSPASTSFRRCDSASGGGDGKDDGGGGALGLFEGLAGLALALAARRRLQRSL